MPRHPAALRILLVLVLAGLALVPAFAGTFYLQLLTKIMILAIFAMSLDLLVGFTGLVSLGHAAFFGVAAYTLGAMTLVYLFRRTLLNSLYGHALLGIRDNEHRMRSLGYPTFLYKLAAFVIAGGLAGLAGYLAAAQFGFVNPEILNWHRSGEVLLIAVLGGMGTLLGPAVGALVLVWLPDSLVGGQPPW